MAPMHNSTLIKVILTINQLYLKFKLRFREKLIGDGDGDGDGVHNYDKVKFQ